MHGTTKGRTLAAVVALVVLALSLAWLTSEPVRIEGKPPAPVATSEVVDNPATRSGAAALAFVSELAAAGFAPLGPQQFGEGEAWASGDRKLVLSGGTITLIGHGQLTCLVPNKEGLPRFKVEDALAILELVTNEAKHASFVPGPTGQREADVTVEYAGRQLTVDCFRP